MREEVVTIVEVMDRRTVPVLKMADCKGVKIQNTISMIDPARNTPQCLDAVSKDTCGMGDTDGSDLTADGMQQGE